MPERILQRVAIIGSGGREHALGKKISQSPHVEKLFFLPGNGGTSDLGANVNIEANQPEDIARFVYDQNVDLTVIGPETALEAGVSDLLTQNNHAVFGPSKEAAKLETSKAYAAGFLAAHDIPHPETWVFTDPVVALAHIGHNVEDYVIKASSLAAGKGVFLPKTLEEAKKAIMSINSGKVSGVQGDVVVIQRRVKNAYEASILVFSDGTIGVPLQPAQDFKRAHDGDTGPNTGGMGSFAPSHLSSQMQADINTRIIQPTIQGMAQLGAPFKGVLYAGLMINEEGPQVIEFNARFGDPETQPLMALLDEDLVPILQACVDGRLSPEMVHFKDGAAVCVVLAEKGYPGKYIKGHEIHGINGARAHHNVEVYHAGTKRDGDRILTHGGRVLGVTAYDKTVSKARERAYNAIGKEGVWFDGMEFRSDIAKGK